jgi:predicted nucleotidyltransferase component of viral defense system
MNEYRVNITRARLLHHAPATRQGAEAAAVDIAQDLLLRHLHDIGLLDLLAFKGGTCLRKLYAGAQGRFSLDLDFSVRDVTGDADATRELLTEAVTDLVLGPFRYGTTLRRGKTHLLIDTDLVPTGTLSSKLDVNPPPWLEPSRRGWVPMDIHSQYGGPLPKLTVVQPEENVAEKIARLNRTTTARDVYDLVWIRRHLAVDTALVRRLAVLKIWVDAYGIAGGDGVAWQPAHESYPFDPRAWLRTREASEFDFQDIGQLSVPAPDPNELATDLMTGYAFLANLTDDESTIADLHGSDRTLALRMIAELPTSRLASGSVW